MDNPEKVLIEWANLAKEIKPVLEELYTLLGTANKNNYDDVFAEVYRIYDVLTDKGANWDNFYAVNGAIEALSHQKYYDAIGDDAGIISSVMDWKSQVSDIVDIGLIDDKLKSSDEYKDLKRNIDNLDEVEKVVNAVIEASYESSKAFKVSAEEEYLAQLNDLDDKTRAKLTKKVNTLVKGLEAIKKKMLDTGGYNEWLASPALWYSVQSLLENAFTVDDFEQLDELSGLGSYVVDVESTASWIKDNGYASKEYPEGWYIVNEGDYSEQFELINNIIKYAKLIMTGEAYQ